MYSVKFDGVNRNPSRLVRGDVKICDFVAEYGGHVGLLMWNGAALNEQLEELTFEDVASMDRYKVPKEGSVFLFDSPKLTAALSV